MALPGLSYHPHLVARELAQTEDALFERAKALEGSGLHRRPLAAALFDASRQAGELRQRLRRLADAGVDSSPHAGSIQEAHAFLLRSRELLQ